MFNCFRYFDMTITQIEEMTLREYLIRMEAVRYRMVDDDLRIAKQAWFNQQAKAQKKKGKGTVSAFKNFKEFYDYEKAIEQLRGKSKKLNERHRKLAQLACAFNEQKGG